MAWAGQAFWSLARREHRTVSVSRAVLVDGGLSPPPSKIFPGTKCFMVTVTVDNKEHCGFGPTPSIAQRAAVLEAYKYLKDGGPLDASSEPSVWEEGSDSEKEGDELDLYEATPPLKCPNKECSPSYNSGNDEGRHSGSSSNPRKCRSRSVQSPSPSQFSSQRPPHSTQYPSPQPHFIQRLPLFSAQRPSLFQSPRPSLFQSQRPSLFQSPRPSLFPSQHPPQFPSQPPPQFPSQRPPQFPAQYPPYPSTQHRNHAECSMVPVCRDADSVLAALLDVAQRKAVDIKFEFLFFTTEVVALVVGGGLSFVGKHREKHMAGQEAAMKMLEALERWPDLPPMQGNEHFQGPPTRPMLPWSPSMPHPLPPVNCLPPVPAPWNRIGPPVLPCPPLPPPSCHIPFHPPSPQHLVPCPHASDDGSSSSEDEDSNSQQVSRGLSEVVPPSNSESCETDLGTVKGRGRGPCEVVPPSNSESCETDLVKGRGREASTPKPSPVSDGESPFGRNLPFSVVSPFESSSPYADPFQFTVRVPRNHNCPRPEKPTWKKLKPKSSSSAGVQQVNLKVGDHEKIGCGESEETHSVVANSPRVSMPTHFLLPGPDAEPSAHTEDSFPVHFLLPVAEKQESFPTHFLLQEQAGLSGRMAGLDENQLFTDQSEQNGTGCKLQDKTRNVSKKKQSLSIRDKEPQVRKLCGSFSFVSGQERVNRMLAGDVCVGMPSEGPCTTA